MRTIRLFTDAPLEPGIETPLDAFAAGHAVRVLRLGSGDHVTLFNGDGHEYPARLSVAGSQRVCAVVESRRSPPCESPLRITLVQALVRAEKMDWIVRKATELGAVRIAPVWTERSEVKRDAMRTEKRLAHWRAALISACEQCGRNVLPRIDPPARLVEWLDASGADQSGRQWALCPGGGTRLRDPGSTSSTITLAVGPEGGFGEGDLDALRAHGFRELSLGPRILRTETAGVAAIAALQALHGDL